MGLVPCTDGGSRIAQLSETLIHFLVPLIHSLSFDSNHFYAANYTSACAQSSDEKSGVGRFDFRCFLRCALSLFLRHHSFLIHKNAFFWEWIVFWSIVDQYRVPTDPYPFLYPFWGNHRKLVFHTESSLSECLEGKFERLPTRWCVYHEWE
jgi:hypothetical protein